MSTTELVSRLEAMNAELLQGEPVMVRDSQMITAGDLLAGDSDLPGLWNILNAGCGLVS